MLRDDHYDHVIAFGEVHVSLFVAGAAFVKFMCHFLWQAQHLVKCGMIAGAGNAVIFNRICSQRAQKVPSAARRVAVCICMVGSVSDHGRIGRALEMTLQPFSANFSKIWECNFAWQVQ